MKEFYFFEIHILNEIKPIPNTFSGKSLSQNEVEMHQSDILNVVVFGQSFFQLKKNERSCAKNNKSAP